MGSDKVVKGQDVHYNILRSEAIALNFAGIGLAAFRNAVESLK